MDTSCIVSQIGDSIEAREQGILNSHARKVSEKEMRPELGKTCDRPSIYPWVSPLILLYQTGAIFSRLEKLEDKPEIKEVLPPSRISWKSRRFNQADRRLRKCRPTEWSRALDRLTRWANDQEYVVSTEKTGKVKKQPRNVSWLNLATHWDKFFERGFEKF